MYMGWRHNTTPATAAISRLIVINEAQRPQDITTLMTASKIDNSSWTKKNNWIGKGSCVAIHKTTFKINSIKTEKKLTFFGSYSGKIVIWRWNGTKN